MERSNTMRRVTLRAYDLGRAADALRDIEGRGTQGKLYLRP